MIVATPACDNVEWGGAEVHMEPPPPVERPAEDTTSTGAPGQPPPPPLPEGPVLYAGTRSGDRVTLRPVGELRGDTLRPLLEETEAPGFLEHFRARRLAPGTEFVLFAGGSRVGTLIADTSAVAADICRARATVSGLAELTLPASSSTRFLALPRSAAEGRTHTGYVADRVDEDARALSLNLASRVIMREEALWPDDLGQSRADLHVIPLPDADGTAIAATFMFRDQLTVGPPASPTVGYSLFVLGSGGDEGTQLSWDWYREVADEGKGAPRYFEAGDWDGDGTVEILLELLGDSSRWMVALDRRGDDWEPVFEESCPGGTAAGDGD